MNWDKTTYGIPDEAFERGTVPMTKSEIRAISLSKLQLMKDSKVLDIGCGTGSISIECGLLCPNGFITAIDQNEEAVLLTQKNAELFNVNNLLIIRGKAPDDLPNKVFDRVFLGGGSKAVEPIIQYVKKSLKADGLFVANTILLESTYKILDTLEKEGFVDITCTHIQTSRGVQNPGWMMKALNPIYIISATIPRREEEANG